LDINKIQGDKPTRQEQYMGEEVDVITLRVPKRKVRVNESTRIRNKANKRKSQPRSDSVKRTCWDKKESTAEVNSTKNRERIGNGLCWERYFNLLRSRSLSLDARRILKP